MTRSLGYRATVRAAKAKRGAALARPEIGAPTAPRRSPASPTSMAVKIPDADTGRLVAEFLERKMNNAARD